MSGKGKQDKNKDKYDHYDDDDNYAAKLLAEDAKKSSLKYASIGLAALLPRQSKDSAPKSKPNTRFLKNLIREADGHNAALKKREDLEAKNRLREIAERDRNQDGRHRHVDAVNHRSHDQERSRKRRRVSSPSDSDRDLHGSHRHGSIRRTKRSASPKDRRERRHRHRHRHRDRSDEEPRSRSRSRERSHRSHYRRERSMDGVDVNDHEARSGRHRQPSRPESHARWINESEKGDGEHKSRGKPGRKTPTTLDSHKTGLLDSFANASRPSSFEGEAIHQVKDDAVDSDPLEDLVGPLPPQTGPARSVKAPRIRGRGAAQSSNYMSNIDNHFAPNYDPTLDVQPLSLPSLASGVTRHGQPKDHPTDSSDWDMALEALRDRQSYKTKQASRMRDAGFTESEIAKWERRAAAPLPHSSAGRTIGNRNGIEDGDASNVRWKKKGELREWDMGKAGVAALAEEDS